MAKDDYDVIVYKVLVYLYACKKRIEIFDIEVFYQTIRRDVNEDYFVDVLYMMQEEGLITGLTFTKIWGGAHILASDESDMEITAEGIHYLKNNSNMHGVEEFLIKTVDVVVPLVKAVLQLKK